MLTAGQAEDCPPAGYLLAARLAPTCEIVTDAAYHSDERRHWIAAASALAMIPPNLRRKYPSHFGPLACAKRHYIQQIINKLKQH